MSFVAETHVVNKPTSGGPVNLEQELATFGSEVPQALLIEVLSVTGPGARAGNTRYSFGWAVAGSYHTSSVYQGDAVSPSVASRRASNTGVAVVVDASNNVITIATVTFAPHKWTLTFNPNDATAWELRVTALGGSSFSCEIGVFSASATGSFEVSHTLGPRKGILFLNSRSTAAAGGGSNAVFGIGAYDGTNQSGVSIGDESGSNPTDAARAFSNTAAILALTGAANAFALEASVTAWDDDSFTVNVTTFSSGAPLFVAYLIFNIVGGEFKVFNQAAPTSTGTQTPVTGLLLPPVLALLWSAMTTTSSIGTTGARVALGQIDPAGQSALLMVSTDNVATSSIDQNLNDAAAIQFSNVDGGAIDGVGVATLLSDGLEVAFPSDAPPSAWLYGGGVFSGPPLEEGMIRNLRYYKEFA